MTDDELESRIESLFDGVTAPDGVRRWENEPVELPRASGGRAALVRLPALRRPFGRWAPLALAAAISIVVGVAGLVAGGVHLRGGGTSGANDAGTAGTAGLPPARLDPAVAYDPAMHAVVMFGGRDKDGKALADTWAWDGKGWKQLHPATSPPARSGAGIAWDAADGRLVLAGGMGSFELQPNTSWTCSTSNQSQNGSVGSSVACSGGGGGTGFAEGCAVPTNGAPANAPVPTCSWRAVPPKLPAVVPSPPAVFADTWTWDGSDWHAEHPAHSAPASANPQMVTDPAGGVVMTSEQYAATPAIACSAPTSVPNRAPPPPPACLQPIYRTPATHAARWDGHDWASLANIPAFNVQLATAGSAVVALPSTFTYCGPPLEGAAGAAGAAAGATNASIACPLIGDVPNGTSSSTSSSAGTFTATASSGHAPAGTSVTVSATASATGSRVPVVEPLPPQKPQPVGPLYSYVLKGSSWQQQSVARGPAYLDAVSSYKGAILAIDVSGRTWTGDGRTWHDLGTAPLGAFGGNMRLVEDTDRHVAVLVGGYPATSTPVFEWNGSTWQLRSGTLPSPPAYPKGVPSILPAPVSPPPGPATTVP